MDYIMTYYIKNFDAITIKVKCYILTYVNGLF
jgi:hypothetical protein